MSSPVAEPEVAPLEQTLATGEARPSFAKQVTSGVGVRAATTFFGFLTNFVVARMLGPVGNGYFAFVQSSALLGSTFGKAGLENTVVRFVAGHATEQNNRIAPAVRTSVVISSVISILASVLMYYWAPALAPYLSEGPSRGDSAFIIHVVQFSAFAVLPISVSTLLGQAFVGLHKISEGMAIQLLIQPLAASLLSVAMIPMFRDSGHQQIANQNPGAIYAFVISAFIAGLYSWYKWWKLQRSLPKQDSGLEAFRPLLASGGPLLMTLIQFFLKWSPVYMLKMWSTVAEIGIFNIAMRTAFLLVFVMSAVKYAVSPMFTELYIKKDFEGMADVAKKSAHAMASIAFIPLVIFLVAPRFVMGLYGPGFTAGALTLVVITVGQYINVVTGSVQQLLMMTGHERAIGWIYGAMIPPYLAIMFWLAPQYGAFGAGVATAVINIVQNLICAVVVYKKLGIWTLPGIKEWVATPGLIKQYLRKLKARLT